MKDQNIRNYQKIVEYRDKLIKIQPYVKNKEIYDWIEEDFSEIQLIQKKLQAKRIIRKSILW